MCARLQIVSSNGDGAGTCFFENCLMFLHDLHFFVYAKHGLSFVLVKGVTTMMVLRHLLYAHWTNFEFVGVAWA